MVLNYWRKLLRVPWTVRSNQSILKEISPEYSLEGLMLKLKLQYFGHLMQRKAGGEEDDRGWDGWMASPTQWTWVGVNSGSWWSTGKPGVLHSMALQSVGHDWSTELNWGLNRSAKANLYFYFGKYFQSWNRDFLISFVWFLPMQDILPTRETY